MKPKERATLRNEQIGFVFQQHVERILDHLVAEFGRTELRAEEGELFAGLPAEQHVAIIRETEMAADAVARKIFIGANRTFNAPIDREDIHALARGDIAYRRHLAMGALLAVLLLVGYALLGRVADHTGIAFVYQVCAFLPAIGLLAWFLPAVEKPRAASSGESR